MGIFDKCQTYKRVEEVQEKDMYPYFTPIKNININTINTNGKNLIMVGSNNYLGLTHHPKVVEAAKNAIAFYGTASCGSRLFSGTLQIHIDLEQRLAQFMNKPAALTFSTGFLTNQGIITALIRTGDCIIYDRGVHASIVDACRLSKGKIKKFRHNDMTELERILNSIPSYIPTLVVVDGVYSMEGDLADLPNIVKLKQKHNFRLLVDDAHGIGVLGQNGRGTAEHLKVENNVDLIMGTFSKSFASLGGFVVGEKEVITFIQRHSETSKYSTSMTPAAASVVLAVLDIIENEPERRQRLKEISKKMKSGFQELGFDTGLSATHIIPVIAGGDEMAFMFWKLLKEDGIFVNPIISPAVPKGRALLRTSYSALHLDDELETILKSFEKCGRLLGLIDWKRKNMYSNLHSK